MSDMLDAAAPPPAQTAEDAKRLVTEQIPLARLMHLALEEASAAQVRLHLPLAGELCNHVGGLHAAAQFAAAETAALVIGYLQFAAGGVTCISKAVDLRFRKPARADLWATAQPEKGAGEGSALAVRLTAEGKVDVPVLVALVDAAGERVADGTITVNIRRL